MDRGLFIAMSGAKQALSAQSLNANNLANMNTTGFRADLARVRELQVQGAGMPTRSYGLIENNGVLTTPGDIRSTGNDMDVAIKGDGYLAVLGPNGQEALTRAGNLKVNSVGQLLTGSGMQVMGNGGPITLPPFEKIEIASDGTISVLGQGQQATTLAAVDRLKLVKPDTNNLIKNEFGLLTQRDGTEYVPDASVKVVSGSLESSNVNAISAMTTMIDLSRKYESYVKFMKTMEDIDKNSTKILSLS